MRDKGPQFTVARTLTVSLAFCFCQNKSLSVKTTDLQARRASAGLLGPEECGRPTIRPGTPQGSPAVRGVPSVVEKLGTMCGIRSGLEQLQPLTPHKFGDHCSLAFKRGSECLSGREESPPPTIEYVLITLYEQNI